MILFVWKRKKIAFWYVWVYLYGTQKKAHMRIDWVSFLLSVAELVINIDVHIHYVVFMYACSIKYRKKESEGGALRSGVRWGGGGFGGGGGGGGVKRESEEETLWWRHNWRWRLKSPASRLFTQSFIQTQIKENIKDPCHWSLCGEFTGDRWIPHTNGQ